MTPPLVTLSTAHPTIFRELDQPQITSSFVLAGVSGHSFVLVLAQNILLGVTPLKWSIRQHNCHSDHYLTLPGQPNLLTLGLPPTKPR